MYKWRHWQRSVVERNGQSATVRTNRSLPSWREILYILCTISLQLCGWLVHWKMKIGSALASFFLGGGVTWPQSRSALLRKTPCYWAHAISILAGTVTKQEPAICKYMYLHKYTKNKTTDRFSCLSGQWDPPQYQMLVRNWRVTNTFTLCSHADRSIQCSLLQTSLSPIFNLVLSKFLTSQPIR